MLNTLPSSATSRRRGGQPSNRNALKHGYFAVRNLTPFTPRLDPIQSGSPLSRRSPLPALYARAIQSVRQQIALTFDAASHATGFKSILTWQRALLRHLALFIRYRKALARHQQSQFQLELCASHTLAFIRRDLQEKGFPIQKYSFRGKPELMDDNSPASPHPFLTAYQWALLEPLLPVQELPSPLGLVPERARVPERACTGRVGAGGEVLPRPPSHLSPPSPRCHLLETRPSRPLAGSFLSDDKIPTFPRHPSPNVFFIWGGGGGGVAAGAGASARQRPLLPPPLPHWPPLPPLFRPLPRLPRPLRHRSPDPGRPGHIHPLRRLPVPLSHCSGHLANSYRPAAHAARLPILPPTPPKNHFQKPSALPLF